MITRNRIFYVIIILVTISLSFASHGWDTWNVDIIGKLPNVFEIYSGSYGHNAYYIDNGVVYSIDMISHEDYTVIHDFYEEANYSRSSDIYHSFCSGYVTGDYYSFYKMFEQEYIFRIENGDFERITFDVDIEILSVCNVEDYLYAVTADSLYIFDVFGTIAERNTSMPIPGDFIISSDSIMFVHNLVSELFTKLDISDPLLPVVTWQDTMAVSYSMAFFDNLIIEDMDLSSNVYRTYDVRSDSGMILIDEFELPNSNILAFLCDSEVVYSDHGELINYNILSHSSELLYTIDESSDYISYKYPFGKFGINYVDSFLYGQCIGLGIYDSLVRQCDLSSYLGLLYYISDNELLSWSRGRDTQINFYHFYNDSTVYYESCPIDSFQSVLYISADTLITRNDTYRISIYNRVALDSFVFVEEIDSLYINGFDFYDGQLVAIGGGFRFVNSWSSFWEDTIEYDYCGFKDMALNDTIAYVLSCDNILIFNASEPEELDSIGFVSFPSVEIQSVEIFNDKLYCLPRIGESRSFFFRIWVYDISDPESVFVDSSFDFGHYEADHVWLDCVDEGFVNGVNFEITNTGVMIAYDNFGITCLDISDYPVFSEVGYAENDSVYLYCNVKFSDDLIFCWHYDKGFSVFDISYFTDPSSRESVTYESEVGWNLLSNPFEDYMLSENLFTTPTETYEYEPSIRTYNTQDTLANGAGFWAFSPEFPAGGVFGWELAENTLWDLYPGWNIIGASGHPVAVSDIDTSRIIMPIYGYDIIGRSYFEADTLYPTKGYWIMSPERQYLEIE